MTVPGDNGFDPTAHLSVQDVAVDDPSCPGVVRVRIKQSKTDPFRRGKKAGPLFMFASGLPLTRQRFVTRVREALQEAGLDEAKYCGHSFRIGAATTAAAKGFEDSVIKTLGRWRSLAYLQYIKIPRSELAYYSRLLCAP